MVCHATVPTGRTLIGILAARAFCAPQALHRNLPGMLSNLQLQDPKGPKALCQASVPQKR